MTFLADIKKMASHKLFFHLLYFGLLLLGKEFIQKKKDHQLDAKHSNCFHERLYIRSQNRKYLFGCHVS